MRENIPKSMEDDQNETSPKSVFLLHYYSHLLSFSLWCRTPVLASHRHVSRQPLRHVDTLSFRESL